MAKIQLFALSPVQHGLELVLPGKKFHVETEAEAQQLIDAKVAQRERPELPVQEQTGLV